MSKSIPEKFCVLPFTHLNLKPQGRVACCWRQQRSIGDYSKEKLSDLWQGKKIKAIRESFLRNQLPAACDSCRDLEEKGVESTRQRLNKIHSFMSFDEVIKNRDKIMPYSIEVRFSNKCNLKCRHCNPQYSSTWFSAYKNEPDLRDVYLKTGFYDERMLKHFDQQSNEDLSEGVIDEIVERMAPHLGHIVITGGEPLLQKQHFLFLKRILPFSSKITLDYNSNLTVLGVGGESVLDFWPRFKKVSLRVSIDGTPEVYSHLRHASKIALVEKNISILQSHFTSQHLELLGTLTTSLYNVRELIETVRYFNGLGILFHASLVQYPKFMRITALPREEKAELSEKVEGFLESIETDKSWDSHQIWNSMDVRHLNISYIRHHLRLILTYMNSSDDSALLSNFHEYNKFIGKPNG